MTTRDFGFEPITGLEGRIDEFLDSLTEAQAEEFRKLSEAQDMYYRDAKAFLQNAVEYEWANKTVPVRQRQINIVLAATNVMLRAMTKAKLAAGEILLTGTTGPLAPETERLINIDKLGDTNDGYGR